MRAVQDELALFRLLDKKVQPQPFHSAASQIGVRDGILMHNWAQYSQLAELARGWSGYAGKCLIKEVFLSPGKGRRGCWRRLGGAQNRF
ncbi:hypothetical protein D3C85_1654390 [compost metagenome]